MVVRKVNTLFGRHKAIHCQCDPSHNYNNRIDKTTRNTTTITTHRPWHSEQTLPIRIFVVPVFDRVSAVRKYLKPVNSCACVLGPAGACLSVQAAPELNCPPGHFPFHVIWISTIRLSIQSTGQQ